MGVALASIIRTSRVHAVHHILVVLGRIEELLGRHHHLLLMVLASIWCFTLVYQVEQVSLIILWNAIGCSYSITSDST